MVDIAVLDGEGADARPVARIGRDIRSRHRGDLCDRAFAATQFPLLHRLARLSVGHRRFAAIVVFDAAAALFLRREPDIEIMVEIAVGRRSPIEGPAHPPLKLLQLCEWCAGNSREGDIVIFKMHGDAVEAVGDRGAGRAAGRVIRSEHEMIDEKLRATLEKGRERNLAPLGLKAIILLHLHPGQFLAAGGNLVAAPGQLLFLFQQG